MEEWRAVEGYKNHLVSNKGRVLEINYKRIRSKGDCGQQKLLNINDNGNGYKTVSLYIKESGIARARYVHRLVAQAFIENPDNLPQVGHKDDDKENNCVDNLYWCSGSRNIKDAHKTGRMKKRSEIGTIERYDEFLVAKIYRLVKTGQMGVGEAGREFGLPRTTVSSYMNKRSWVEMTDAIDKELENP